MKNEPAMDDDLRPECDLQNLRVRKVGLERKMSNPKTVEQLQERAAIYWPSEIARREKNSSIIPLLLKTQDCFISVLHLASKDPYDWTKILGFVEDLHPNIFLKHLCILSDIGGENLKRFAADLPEKFKSENFKFSFRGKNYDHEMKSLSDRKWSNPSLGLDGEGLQRRFDLTDAIRDVSTLILFGGLSTNDFLPDEIKDKCIIGSMLGDKPKLEKYIKERYIWVSRITGGATSNRMGHLAQNYVRDRLAQYLPDWDFSQTTIPGISQNEGRTDTKFDIVGKGPDNNYWGIEVSFQFTTNSVVERKAKLASERQRLLHEKGYKVAYVVDGAGNFERRSFVQDLINYSDCIINFSDGDIRRLAQTMKGDN